MWKLAVAIAIGAVGIPLGAAIAQQAQQPDTPPSANKESGSQVLQVPDTNQLMILIRSTLLAVNHANLTGNYTVLRELGTPGFQQSNTAAQLGDIFRTLRERDIDLGPIALLDAKLRREPSVNANGQLRLTGFFPSRPEQVNFDLAFYNRNGRWLLDGIALNTTVSQAASNGPQGPSASNSQTTGAKPATAAATKPPAPAKKPSATTPKKLSPSVEDRVETLESSPPKKSKSKSRSWNPFSSF